MNNFKCTIAYSGTRYCGFQKTKMGPSIEEALEKAFEVAVQHAVKVQGASRTDQGVHASGQVVQFYADTEDLFTLQGSLRRLLPEDISLLSIEKAPASFHPSLDAQKKLYRYQIMKKGARLPFQREFAWYHYLTLNVDAMRSAAKLLLGTHDFSAFSNEQVSDPIRTLIRLDIQEEEDRLLVEVEGTSFLYKMVRNLVGTLADVGSGKISPEVIPQILESRDRRRAGVTAPARGLFLAKIFYSSPHSQPESP